MGIVDTWEQAVAWFVLVAVLVVVASGKVRYEIPAFSGLLVLGLLGLSEPSELFSGFASPALFTVATVLVMSAGIVESGILSGMGKRIAGKLHSPRSQILTVFLTTGLLSALMNNVGAVGVTIPTAQRMAKRANLPSAAFGIPIAFAAILGGSVTLIGTASNLIISTYRLNTYGEPFRMFDFTLPGLTLLAAGIAVIFVCSICGFGPVGKTVIEQSKDTKPIFGEVTENAAERSTKKSIIVVTTLVAAVVLAGTGVLHPAIGFGIVVLLWLLTHVMSYKNALLNINISVVIFLGSMLGISNTLQKTGALSLAVSAIGPVITSLPPYLLILIILFITALFTNLLNNSAAAVLMAPVAIEISRVSGSGMNPDALLMAVAAGASLGIVLPTHQATVVVASRMEFSKKNYMKTGVAIALLAGTLSAFVIRAIW